MIRFTMPDPMLGTKERTAALAEQFDTFLESDAMQTLLTLLDTDLNGIKDKYNVRAKKDGRICETQELSPFQPLEEKKHEIYPLLKELGFFDINSPFSSEYTRILILGASLNTTFLKTKYASRWIDPLVRSVDGLTCFRPLNPSERSASCFKTACDTEFGAASDAFVSVFGLSPDKWSDSFRGDRNLNSISCIRIHPDRKDGCAFRIFAAPSSHPDERRADTGDTISFYLKNTDIRPGESFLAITSNRYCNRQFVQLAYQIIKSECPVGLDVIGNYQAKEIVTAGAYDPCQYVQDVIAIIDWIQRFKKDYIK